VFEIRRLAASEILERRAEFQALVRDAVETMGTVGFVLPVTTDKLDRYWSGVAREAESGEREVLAAFEEGVVIGMLQIAYEKAESVRHRGDLQKLMVLSAHRRRGVARALLRDAMARMRALGLAMYTITTAHEAPTEVLVRQLSFTRYGVMPHYGVTPDGSLHDASMHYISIASAEACLEHFS
jgi:acetyltransferase